MSAGRCKNVHTLVCPEAQLTVEGLHICRRAGGCRQIFYRVPAGHSALFSWPDGSGKQMGLVFDQLSFPQTSHEIRCFGRPAGYLPPREARNAKMEQPIENTEQTSRERESHVTFVIHVRYRQNATWQGEIKWIDQNKSQYFRSSLEMLKLMDMALDEEFGQEIKVEWK